MILGNRFAFDWCLGIAAFLALPCSAQAGLIVYSDDFEQFAAGTDLTTISYTPAIGPAAGANFGTFAGGSSTKTAVDFGGSRAVQLYMPVGSGIEYLGVLPANYSNAVLQFRWDTNFQSLNTGLAGLFIRFPSPVFSMQVLMGYFDDGTIGVFNGPPSLGTLVPIGAFDAGITYQTRMDYDLSHSTYSVYVNNVALLLDEALPGYINQTALDRFGFDGSEIMPTSIGNTWFLDNVSVSVSDIPEPSPIWLIGLGLISFGAIRLAVRYKNSRATPLA